MGFFSKLKEGLTKTRKSLTEKIEKVIIGYADIDDDLLDELEDALIQADVGVKTSLQLMDDVRAGIKKKQINSPEDLKPFLIKRTAFSRSSFNCPRRLAQYSASLTRSLEPLSRSIWYSPAPSHSSMTSTRRCRMV